MTHRTTKRATEMTEGMKLGVAVSPREEAERPMILGAQVTEVTAHQILGDFFFNLEKDLI